MYPLQEQNFSIIPGEIFSGIISHVCDDADLFYLVKTEASVVLIELQEHLEKNPPQKMFWYPANNEKFLLYDDNEYFRARRVDLTKKELNSKENIQALLIDSGNTRIISINNNSQAINTFFMIPEEFINIPAIARKCKFVCPDKSSDERKAFLNSKMLNKILMFEAISVKGDISSVKIWPYGTNDKDFDADLTGSFLEKPIFTQEDLNELDEKPLIAENNEKLCQLSNPMTGECFRGDGCKLKHLSFSDETKDDKKHVKWDTSKVVEVKAPEPIGCEKSYDIQITFFLRINKFIFRFCDPNFKENLEEIQEAINSSAEIKKYVKLSSAPKINQLVLAKINGDFYRAKVIEDDSDNFVVWCLDTGSLKSTTLDLMYEFKEFEKFGYISHEMEVMNISPMDKNQKRGMLEIIKIQEKSGKLLAVFNKIEDDFKGLLYDSKMKDIGEQLNKMRLTN